MSSIKVLLSYENSSSGSEAGMKNDTSLSIKLPKSWSLQPVIKLLDLFIETYNKKFSASLSANDFHLISAEGLDLCSTFDIAQEHLRSGDVIHVAAGKGPGEASKLPQWFIDSSINPIPVLKAETSNTATITNPLDKQCRKKKIMTLHVGIMLFLLFFMIQRKVGVVVKRRWHMIGMSFQKLQDVLCQNTQRYLLYKRLLNLLLRLLQKQRSNKLQKLWHL